MPGCPTATPITPTGSIKRLQRKGYLRRDVQRLVNNDRNVFSACMLKFDDADGMVTGRDPAFHQYAFRHPAGA
jgi:phosphotransacetylase